MKSNEIFAYFVMHECKGKNLSRNKGFTILPGSLVNMNLRIEVDLFKISSDQEAKTVETGE